ncbi:hypothetical protein B0H66DRAFT_623393 [Apodospora peruviana]|uniref:Uncharacterized protein n=1 Tax=Apodospora peruviana TaxID=516989 RepID=A0AAE0I6K1_9PEZI|nr:hypothetical protein B0H66DRAFT_623393 [Apodospora peruviana]
MAAPVTIEKYKPRFEKYVPNIIEKTAKMPGFFRNLEELIENLGSLSFDESCTLGEKLMLRYLASNMHQLGEKIDKSEKEARGIFLKIYRAEKCFRDGEAAKNEDFPLDEDTSILKHDSHPLYFWDPENPSGGYKVAKQCFATKPWLAWGGELDSSLAADEQELISHSRTTNAVTSPVCEPLANEHNPSPHPRSDSLRFPSSAGADEDDLVSHSRTTNTETNPVSEPFTNTDHPPLHLPSARLLVRYFDARAVEQTRPRRDPRVEAWLQTYGIKG